MNIFITAAVAVFLAVLLAFLAPLLLELKQTLRSLRKTNEERLAPALEELSASLRTLRSITDNVDGIVADVRHVTDAVHDIGDRIAAASRAVDAVTTGLAGSAIGLRAGIMAAVTYFATNLIRKGDRQ